SDVCSSDLFPESHSREDRRSAALPPVHAVNSRCGPFGLSEGGVEAAALALEPGVGSGEIAFEQAAQERVEGRRMVEVREVRDLVRDDRAAYGIRRLDQPPVDADAALARATAPAA